ncbi:recombinase family protein [Enterobacter roggenkampii]|uniref:recombinase family protein n=1 Tax=Enterobacter roggenkampii TaxID=1812935 RepID=UPI0020057380|nr:recombinase family protein [Enterobacter roggenkampii]MCK7050053.1 recombinase family protein [Enterobacter roggenkampii]
MKTLTLYRRVSHDMQTGEDKDGLKRQERSFKKFLSSFPDLSAYKQEEISDEGLSAYHGVNVSDKGGLGLYLKRVTSGEIERGSMLVCEEQSRLTRLPHRIALRMLWELEDHGIIIWSIKDNRAISGDDFSNDIMTMLNAKGAHDYSAEIARKVGDAKRAQQKAARIDKTGHLGNICPYWLKPLGKGKFEPIPEHVTTIKRIFAERFQLRSMAAIAAGLNADNRPLITSRNWKKRAAPTGWTQSMVKNLLNNPRVMGTLPESDRKGSIYPEVKGYYGDPIVPLEHWLAAQESLSQKGKKAVRNDANPFSVRLFKSLIICKFCGHKMDVNGARGALSERGTPYHGSLICRNARENSCMHGVNHSRTPALPMKLVEHALTTNLFRNLKQRDVSAGAQERIAQLSLEVIELEQAIQQNTNDLATIRNQNARTAILQMIDAMGEELDQKRVELATEQRKQQSTTLETLEGLDLLSVDGRLEAQRVIAKNISLISVDTVAATADITLRNGNIITGFMLDSTSDKTALLAEATDDEKHAELTAIIGEHLPLVIPAGEAESIARIDYDSMDFPPAE